MLSVLIAACANTNNQNQDSGQHLFILSGQSNMVRLVPEHSFTPVVTRAFGIHNVIVVKSAAGGQPIYRWDKQWINPNGQIPEKRGDLYQVLMNKVNKSIENKSIKTVTFVWMQGERDAKQKWSKVYKSSFKSVVEQLKTDLNLNSINVVIGRLSDFDLANKKYKHWTKIRNIQQQLAQELPNASWVNTDDLNDGYGKNGQPIKDDLHMSQAGYQTLGERFAQKSIALIKD